MTEIEGVQKVEFQISQHSKSAVLFGATGMIGNELLRSILKHQAYQKLITFGRSEIKATHPKLQHYVINFEEIDTYKHLIKGNDLYISLGTTMKKAGSKEAFRKIDFDLIFKVAKLASLNEMSQLMLVSSVGADPDSLFFYSRVKGELEEAVRKLPFWAVHIFRPSLLLGDRTEKRFGEKIAVKVTKRIRGLAGPIMGKYNPIEAKVVSKAMVNVAQQMKSGTFIYESPELEKLSDLE
jgi:uncharacterized protein YbjT (DUF2867 family)